MKGLKIASTGRALPARVVTNDDMSRLVETSDEWIASRTGIRARHFCERETQTDLAGLAAQRALERGKVDPRGLCACIVATVTPDTSAPTSACLLQQRLGLPEDIPCFDMNVGCTGFIYALQVARGLLLQSERPYALIVGAEALSRITDFTDRGTCVLFGDGAGAAVVTLAEGGPYACTLGARGDAEAIFIAGPGPQPPCIRMDGQKVFRFAVEAVPHCVHVLLEETGLALEDIDWFVPHQANKRIIDHVAKKLKAPNEKFYQNMMRYGNTSAASIPIALDEMAEQGLLRRGQKVLCVGFGAGLTWGGVLLEW
ncbi:beta-ketoacyl-ACP synthase III [Intestinimonas sp.]|uniref:beta-ketoacyl-ACP synthase III n=1 Tax=Intestinimonas sp. TaxID=1965293 RepID=UPI0026382444|nr:beta-ketoacyl-ACP synthase III [Intestinimonas sp.]